MFLKYLNAVLKNFASALELFFTTVASFLFFQIEIDTQTIISIVLIWISLYVYALQPIAAKKSEKEEEETELISEDAWNYFCSVD